MRAALSTYTYTWAVGVPGYPPARPLGLLDLLERCRQLDVAVLQVADNLPLRQLSTAEMAMFAGRASELGISVEVGTRGIDEADVRAYLAVVAQLGSPLLRTIVVAPDHVVTPEEAIERLKPHKGEFQRVGARLAIENHDKMTASQLAQIVEGLGTDWAGICLDTVNSFGALEGPSVVVDQLGPLAINVHMKDFEVTRASHMMGFSVEGRPLGQGRLDVPWLVGRLGGAARDMTAVIELWTPPEDDLTATIEKERQWAEMSVHYLREVLS